MYWLLTENYVLNANILVFMLIHTELFSNVSGLVNFPDASVVVADVAGLSVSVCLSVTSQCSIKTSGRIELF